jgi:hypothetical protein
MIFNPGHVLVTEICQKYYMMGLNIAMPLEEYISYGYIDKAPPAPHMYTCMHAYSHAYIHIYGYTGHMLSGVQTYIRKTLTRVTCLLDLRCESSYTYIYKSTKMQEYRFNKA